MKTDTGKKIVAYIKQQGQSRVGELVRELGISHVAVHKQLKTLVNNGQLRKFGRPPRVYYLINENQLEP